MLAVEHDQARRRCRAPACRSGRARAAARPGPRARSRASSWWTRRPGSRARRARRGPPGRAPPATSAPELAEDARRAPRSRPGGRGRRSAAPRLPAAVLDQPAAPPRARRSRARPSARRGRATPPPRARGRSKWVVASTIAAAVRSGSSDLKMPEPTKTPSAPSCIISAASAGVAMPPAQKSTTGSRPRSATSRTRSSGARELLGGRRQLGLLERARAGGSRP